jgi:GntR family transcriptional regulator / MocR family aminotransferase
MPILKELIVIDKNSHIPVYIQVANAVIQNIHQGKFRKGLRLPGSRQLAALLKINRMTAVAAYQELDSQGWTETMPKKGTFVKVDPPLLSPKGLREESKVFKLPENTGFGYDVQWIVPLEPENDFPSASQLILNPGFPDIRLAPIEELIRSIRRLSRQSFHKKYLTYGGAQGTIYLRETLAAFLCDTRGLSVTPENILITKGSQMGIYLAAAILIQPGEEVIVGTPGYVGANRTFLQAGARINYVPVDEGGIDTQQVERLCEKKNIRMVYVISHHHHPTTVTLTPGRRIHLLELAARYKFAIIEDDYDYDFHYDSKPMMPMASHDSHGNVIYIGALSKSLAPAIRVGFMIAPAAFIRSATHLRKSIDTQGDSLVENAIAELYKDGSITRHIKRSLKLYKERRDHFCGLLRAELGNKIAYRIPEGGMSVWTNFLKNPLPLVVEKAYKKGLIMNDGTSYDTGKRKYNSVGLGFASLNFKEQEKAVAILKEIL